MGRTGGDGRGGSGMRASDQKQILLSSISTAECGKLCGERPVGTVLRPDCKMGLGKWQWPRKVAVFGP
jgi:hypothetical protein